MNIDNDDTSCNHNKNHDHNVVVGDASNNVIIKVSNNQHTTIQLQRVQEKFRDIERVNDEIQVLCGKLHSLCSELCNMRTTSQSTTTFNNTNTNPTNNNNDINNNDFCIGDEKYYLWNLASEFCEAYDHWESGLCFVQECIAIRNNDPSVTTLSLYRDNDDDDRSTKFTTDLPHRVLLSDCFQHNNNTITEMSLHLGSLSEPNDDDYDVFVLEQQMYGILQYMESSTKLRRVTLRGDRTRQANALANMCLCAMSHNPNIIHLEIDFPAVGLDNLLSSSTTSIQSLDIHCCNEISLGDMDRTLIALAIAQNSTVTSLALRAERLDAYDHRNLIDSLLNGSGGYNTSLQKLTLQYDHDSHPDLRSVSSFLRRTTTVQHLVLLCCMFDANNMECLLDGLRQHYSTLGHCSSLTKLSLVDCIYDDAAEGQFLRFMQSTELYKYRTDDSAILEELHIDFMNLDEDYYDMDELTFGGLTCGIAMASMVMPLRVPNSNGSEIQPTVGSQLKVLSLQPFFAMVGFCDHVLSDFTLMQVPELVLANVGNNEWLQLATLIPKLKTLRELRLLVDNDVTQKDILSVIRETDHHLHVLSAIGRNGKPFFNDSELQLVQALCQRNITLGSMLCTRKVQWKVEDNNWSARNNKRLKTMNFMSDTNDDVVIFPILLQAAKQIPSTRVSTVLCALLLFEVDCSET